MTRATALFALLLTVATSAWAQTPPTPPRPPDAPQPPRPPRPPREGRDRDSRHEVTDHQVHKLAIGRNGVLDLANISGDVVIQSGGGDEAVVEVTLRGHGETPEAAKEQLGLIYVDVTKGASRAEVRVRYKEHERRGRRNYNASADYRVTAPPDTRVTVHSVSGDVQASRMKGELSIETVSGDVTIDSSTRVSTAKTVSGDVDLTGIASEGSLAASSVSGDVSARGLKASRLELSTVSGSVELHDVACDTAEIQSMSGDVQYIGAIGRQGRYELQSHSGNIIFAPGSGVGFDVEATSFSGEVRSELELKLRASDPDETWQGRRNRKRSIRGTFGDGSAVVELTTFSGDIIIRK
jgi:Putative adhesin